VLRSVVSFFSAGNLSNDTELCEPSVWRNEMLTGEPGGVYRQRPQFDRDFSSQACSDFNCSGFIFITFSEFETRTSLATGGDISCLQPERRTAQSKASGMSDFIWLTFIYPAKLPIHVGYGRITPRENT
jgi:hypothetical protein